MQLALAQKHHPTEIVNALMRKLNATASIQTTGVLAFESKHGTILGEQSPILTSAPQ
jgi:hypothetical protein